MSNPSAYAHALKRIAYKPLTEQEVLVELQEAEFEDAEIEVAVEKLKRERIVNDTKYAREFVELTVKNRPKGKLMIYKKLCEHGVAEDLAEQTLDELYPYEKEAEVCAQLAAKKKAEVSHKTQRQQMGSVGRYLSGKGFSEEMVWDTFHELGFIED